MQHPIIPMQCIRLWRHFLLPHPAPPPDLVLIPIICFASTPQKRLCLPLVPPSPQLPTMLLPLLKFHGIQGNKFKQKPGNLPAQHTCTRYVNYENKHYRFSRLPWVCYKHIYKQSIKTSHTELCTPWKPFCVYHFYLPFYIH